MSERIESVIILDKVNNDSGYSSDLISSIRNDKLNTGFIRELVYGVIENKRLLDYIIEYHLEKKNKKLPSLLREILNISIFQMLFLDSIPDYAVINEAVDMTRQFNLEKYTGFTNAILRKVSNAEAEDYLDNIKDKTKKTKIEYSVSEYFYSMLENNYSKKTILKILKSYNDKQDFIIRINNLKSNRNDVENILEKENYKFINHPYLENSLIIENPKDIFKTKLFKDGFFTVQDGGSSLVAKILNPKENSILLDLCAAPGSKTCYLSEIMNNTGKIIANDVYENKLVKIKENAKRLNCNNIETTSYDGTVYNSDMDEKFDYILLDAPCSGSGIVTRKPEIKLYRTKEQVEELICTQRKLLTNAFKYLKVGGSLVYSTCSIFKEENEEQMNWALKQFKNIELEEVDFADKKLEYIKLMPYSKGNNGFFMCKFKKIV